MPPGGYYTQPQPQPQQLPPDNGVYYDPATDSFVQQTAPDPTAPAPPPPTWGAMAAAPPIQAAPAPPPPSGPTLGPMGQYSAGPIQGTDLPAPVDPYAAGYGGQGYLQSAGGYGGAPLVSPGYGLDKGGPINPPPQYDPAYAEGSAPIVQPLPAINAQAFSPPTSGSYIPLQQNPGLAPGQSIFPPEPDAPGYRTPGGDPTQALRSPATWGAMATPGSPSTTPVLGFLSEVGNAVLGGFGAMGGGTIGLAGGAGQAGSQALIGQPYQTMNPALRAGQLVPDRFRPQAVPPVDPATADLNQRLANIQAGRVNGRPLPPPPYHTGDLTPPAGQGSWLGNALSAPLFGSQPITLGDVGAAKDAAVNALAQPIAFAPDKVAGIDARFPLLGKVDQLLGTAPGGGFGSDPNAITSLATTPKAPAAVGPLGQSSAGGPRSSFPAGSPIGPETNVDSMVVSAEDPRLPVGDPQRQIVIKLKDGSQYPATQLFTKDGQPVLDGAGKPIFVSVTMPDGTKMNFQDFRAQQLANGNTAATPGATDQTLQLNTGTVVADNTSGGSGGGSSGGYSSHKSYGSSSSHSSGGSSHSSGGSSSHSSGSSSGGGQYRSNRDGVYHVTKADGSRVTVDLNHLPDELKNNDAFMSLLKRDPSAAAKLMADHGYGKASKARGARARRLASTTADAATLLAADNGRSGPLANPIFDRYFAVANHAPPPTSQAVMERLPVTSPGGATASKRSASTGNKKK